MGFTTVSMRLINPETPALMTEVELLVDTGALYSIIPAPLLEGIGISRKRQQKFTTANGDVITRWVGNVFYRYQEYEGAAPVIFGEPDDKPVMGVVTLEALGLEVDPISRQLKPAPGLLLLNEDNHALVSGHS